jgi:uncharacterized protein YdhG (YjbR/CyaY superfamily)
MAAKRPARTSPSIAVYVAKRPAAVRPILQRIRAIVAAAAPDASETISYGIPAFRQNGILIYFAAFKNHVGIYPPVSGDARLERALARYRGPKGNLIFPLDEPMPYRLIERVAKLRRRQLENKATRRRS